MAYFRSNKKIKVAKRIRKDAKIKYIDLLTSLKNRNYLSENIDNWNNNPIYPQTALIIDLNDVQEINDHHGYEAGDRQIMAAANILIKNQLEKY
jgi:diguanylate cyclase (GGDEF)-like protein